MRRRDFITLLGGAAMVWPLAARAQQPAMPVVGFLGPTSAWEFANLATAFRQGLGDIGYVEGRNVSIEYRWAEGRYDRLPTLAADLVGRRVDVLAATGGIASVIAAKAATATIPIVFTAGTDPVKMGIVASLNRPGGNVTGVIFFNNVLGPKRLQVLHGLAPKAAVVGMMVNPKNPNTELDLQDVQSAAGSLGVRISVVNASSEREFDAAFARLAEQRAARLSSVPIRSSAARGINWWRWQRSMRCPRSTSSASSRWPAGWSATEPTSQRRIAKPAFIPAGFSVATSLATSRSSSQPSSSWFST